MLFLTCTGIRESGMDQLKQFHCTLSLSLSLSLSQMKTLVQGTIVHVLWYVVLSVFLTFIIILSQTDIFYLFP